MNIATYFKLIRWKNLLLIVFIFFVFKFLVFKTFHLDTNLSISYFIILLLSVLCITAAGYIVNDIFDIKSDSINKPDKLIVSKKITIEKAKQWYKITNVIGIFLGVLFCLKINKPTYSFVFISCALLLYFYSKKIKSTPLLGNILVSILTSVSVLILPLFDINFIAVYNNQPIVIQLIVAVSIFAFCLNLIRELVKDIEDVNGDYSLNMKTLPILIGVRRTRKIALIFTIIPILLLIYIVFKYSAIYKFSVLYLLLFVLIPLFYFAVRLKSAKNKTEFHTLSFGLKIIMFLGINSLIIFSIFQ